MILGLFAYLETLLGPAMPFIRERLDLSFTVASLHFSAFAAGGVVVGFTGDRISHRIGRHGLLWGGIFGMASGVALMAVSPFVIGTVAGAFATGLFGTLALVANQSSLSDLHGDNRTTAIAESNVAASSAAIMAPLAVGGLDAAGFGWHWALLLGLPAAVILAWRYMRLALPAPPPRARELGTARPPLPRTFWIFWCVLFLVASVEWCVAYWGADYLDTEVGLSKASAATAMSIFFAAMVMGRAIGAKLTRRHPGPGLLLAAIGLALIGFPIFWLAPAPVISVIGLFVAGIGIANFYPLTIAAATSAAADRPDQATARLAISGAGALLTVPLLVGAISDLVDMRWGFGIVMPLLITALAGTTAGRRSIANAPV